MCKHSFTYAVKSTIFTNLSRKWSFRIETPLQTGEGTDFKMPCFPLIKLDVIKWKLRPRSLHSCPEKCVNTALLVRLSLPSLLIGHENGAFELKRCLKPEKLIWKCCLFTRISVWIVRGFLKHKSKMTGGYCVFKFLRGGVNRKHLMRFESKKIRFQVSALVHWGRDLKPGLTNAQFVHTI